MFKPIIYLPLLVLYFVCFETNATQQRKQIHNFHFSESDTTESVEVYLPENYSKSDQSYPVLFTTAGAQRLNMMLPMLDWLTHVDWSPIPELIVVTVPTINQGVIMHKDDGASGKFDAATTQWIASTLIPFINKNYRTQRFRILEGFSSYGNFPLYVYLHKPELFHSYISISPALVLDKHGLVERFRQPRLNSKMTESKSLYISLGSFEQNRPLFEKLKHYAQQRPSHANVDFKDNRNAFYLLPPVTTLPETLVSIFSDRVPNLDTIKSIYSDSGVSGIESYFKQLQHKYGSKVSSSSALETLATHFEFNKNQTAISLFQLLTEREPTNLYYQMRLAEVYRTFSFNEQAKTTLEQAIKQARIQKDEEAINTLKIKLSLLE